MSGKVAEFFTVADVPGTGGTDISTVEKAEGYSVPNGTTETVQMHF